MAYVDLIHSVSQYLTFIRYYSELFLMPLTTYNHLTPYTIPIPYRNRLFHGKHLIDRRGVLISLLSLYIPQMSLKTPLEGCPYISLKCP